MVKGTLVGYTDYEFFVDNGKYTECILLPKMLRWYLKGDSVEGLDYNAEQDDWICNIKKNEYYVKHKPKFDILLPGIVVRNNVIVEFDLNRIPIGTTLKLDEFCYAVEPRASLVKSTQPRKPNVVVLTDNVYMTHLDMYLDYFVFDLSKLSNAGVDRLLQDLILYPRQIVKSFIGNTRLNYWIELSYLKYSASISEDRIIFHTDYYDVNKEYKEILDEAVKSLGINYRHEMELLDYYNSKKDLFTVEVLNMLEGSTGSIALIRRYMKCCLNHSDIFKELFIRKVNNLVQSIK